MADGRAVKAGCEAARVRSLLRLAVPAWYLDQAAGNQVCVRAIELSANIEDRVLAAQTSLTAASFRLLYDVWTEEDAIACLRAQESIACLTGSDRVDNVFYVYVLALQGAYREAWENADLLVKAAADPVTYSQAAGALGMIMLSQGQFGDLRQLIRTERELAEKNGEDPWMWIFGEAWLRVICFDFDGARRIGLTSMRSDSEQHAAWTNAVAGIACGYAELYQGNHAEAIDRFAQVRDFGITPKFFLHWHWRMHAARGTAEALLLAGDLDGAHREADGLLKDALATSDPNMQAMAWEMKTRVARAEQDLPGALKFLENALAIVERFEIPVTAWQVHRSAWNVYADEREMEKADQHRALARTLILRLADSFDRDEPLRECLLAFPSVRQIFGNTASA